MKRVSAFLPLLLLLTTATNLASDSPKPRAWEHESSDVPVNPRLNFGRLPNGMRFVWMANPEPQERSYLRLHVDVGSLDEEESERGMAHFLEHLAFNGSRNFPPGTLIEWFQNRGMAFGPDTNAFTSFDQTTYMLDLPQSDRERIREGLKVLRDYADGMLLEPKEVDAEKGVVDAEERERDSAGQRAAIERLKRLFKGSRIASRIPIGTKEARDRFTSRSIRSFYERWYRPENMTLILIGDLEDYQPEADIREYFEDFKAATPERKGHFPNGFPTFEEPFFAVFESEVKTAQINFGLLRPWVDEADNKENRAKYLALAFARSMLNLRFSELVKAEDAQFLGASVGQGDAFELVEGESLGIVADPDKWKQAFAAAEKELRRAIEFGFQKAELDEIRADYLRSLDEAVEREATRSSGSFARQLLSASNKRSVPSNAETNRSILRPAVERLDVEQCHRAFSQAWKEGTMFLNLLGNVDLGENATQILRTTLEESRRAPVEAPDDIELKVFAYGSDPRIKGEIKSRSHIEDLDIHQIEFANGVRVSIKKTDFKEKQILIRGRLGEGLLTLDRSDFALSFLAGQGFVASGLEAHSADDLRRLSAGKQVGMSFSVAQDHFALGGATTSADLLLQCELMAAHLEHPGWREEGLRNLKAFLPRLFESLRQRHDGPLQTKFFPLLYSGDPRFGIPALEKLMAGTLSDLKVWLTPFLSEAPLEVGFVGDLDVEEVIEVTSRTLGRLKPRRSLRPYQERRRVAPIKTGLNESYEIETAVPKTLVYLAFPTTDGRDSRTRRHLFFLSQVVDDRLRVEIREKLGAAYSPSSSAQTSQVFPGVGLLIIRALSDPDKVETLRGACLEVANSLAVNGVTTEEVERLKKPILARVRDGLRTNGFWSSMLDRSQSRPETLDFARNGKAFYEGVKADEISQLAALYLKKDRVSMVVVSPSKKEE